VKVRSGRVGAYRFVLGPKDLEYLEQTFPELM
jgi:hypothetical protein